MSWIQQNFLKYWLDTSLFVKATIVIIFPLSLILGSLTYLYVQERNLEQLEYKLFLAVKNQQNIQLLGARLNEATIAVSDHFLKENANAVKDFEHYQIEIETTAQVLSETFETNAQKKKLMFVLQDMLQDLRTLKGILDTEVSKNNKDVSNKFFYHHQTSLAEKIKSQLDELAITQSVLIEQDYMAINEKRRNALNIALTSIVFGVMGIIVSVLVLSRTVIKRFKLLCESASRLARGEEINIETKALDELGYLSCELKDASKLLTTTINELHRARKETENANAAKSVFLSRTSHELRTPLHAIIGFSSLLEIDLKDDLCLKNLNMIQKASKHLLKLIDELLDIARIEEKKIDIVLTTVQVSVLVREAIHYIQPLGQARHISFKQDTSPEVFVKTDRQKLLQVLLNLLSNAIKYGPDNSMVEVTAGCVEQFVYISVIDQGGGISADLMSRLFVPFDRIAAEDKNIEGAGLGLALSKQIMLAMQGDILVTENTGTFTLKVPLSLDNLDIKNDENILSIDAVDATSARKRLVLYVENDKMKLSLVKAILRRYQDVELLSCNHVEDAKKLLEAQTPVLVLLDLSLLDVNDTEVLAYLKSIIDKTNVWGINLLNRSDAEINSLKELGVQKFFTNPLDVLSFSSEFKQIISA